ncbi:MAG: amino acid adenylation domain-containing protein [Fluviicola sp.]
MKEVYEIVISLQQKGIYIDSDGGRLKLTGAISSLTKEEKDKIVLLKDSFIEFCEKRKHLHVEDSRISALPLQPDYALSSSQMRLWILNEVEEGSPAYNIFSSVELNSTIDIETFKRAILLTVKRHEILRTIFIKNDEDEPRQKIIPFDEFNFSFDSLDFRTNENKDDLVSRYIKEDGFKPFDLSNGPLFRICLIRKEDEQFVLYYNMHHIISDEWSMNILTKEIMGFYESLITKKEATLPELSIQYKDYAKWQIDQLDSEVFEAHKEYWKNRLSGNLPLLDLPTSKIRPKIKTYSGAQISTYVDRETTKQLKSFVKENGGTLFMGLLASLSALFQKYTGNSDIIMGTPISGREHADLSDQIGFYINTMVIRTEIHSEDSFEGLFKRTKEQTNADYQHQMYPFDQLLNNVDYQRDMARSAIFDVMLKIQNIEETANNLELSQEQIDKISLDGFSMAKFDMSIAVEEIGSYLSLAIVYNTNIYDEQMMVQFLGHYKQILSVLLKNPNQPIGKINYLNDEEKEDLITNHNNTALEYPRDKTIVDLFEDQVRKTPDNIAITDGNVSMSYSELDAKVRKLAAYILENTFDETYVIVHQSRGLNLIISVMAILKAGKAYVPVEPYIPFARKQVVLNSVDWNLVLTDEENYASISMAEFEVGKIEIVREILEQERDVADISYPTISPEDIAYIIFTSGSTGVPKGVIVQHTPVVNLIDWVNRTFEVNQHDKLLCVASISFDLSVYDIFGILATGGSIRIALSDEVGNPDKLAEILFTEEITFWNSAPAALMQVVSGIQGRTIEKGTKNLRLVFLSGDWISVNLPTQLKQTFSNANVISLGGATEATVWSNYYVINKVDPNWRSIPYGKPIQNAKYYILDEYLIPCPIGIAGDLYIGGQVLAVGYNDAELSAKKFIDNPFIPGERMYHTGDKARYFPDGNIEFLGRVDDQVKVRGYRIEIGEIEVSLLQIEGIKEAVVIAKEDVSRQKSLFAYIVCDANLSMQSVKSELRKTLPDYMIPIGFVQLDKMPTTANGKLDKKSLPSVQLAISNEEREILAPTNETEQKIHDFWLHILGEGDYSMDDDFFGVGGDSLKIMRLRTLIHQDFAIELKYSDLFAYNSIQLLAEFIDKAQNKNTLHLKVEPDFENRYEPFPLTSVQRSYFIGRNEAFELGTSTQLYFEQDLNGIDPVRLNKSFIALLQRHEMLRAIFTLDGMQQIKPFDEVRNFSIPCIDLSSESEDDYENKLAQLRQEKASQQMDLTQWPQFDICLLKKTDSVYKALITIDIIIVDDFSLPLLMEDLYALYVGDELPELSFSFRDYVMGLEQIKSTDVYKSAASYWTNRIERMPLGPNLPLHKDPGMIQELNHIHYGKLIDPQKWEGLKWLASTNNVSPTVLFVSAFSYVLKKWSSSNNFTLNLTLFNRLPLHAEVDMLVGDFTATELLEVNWDDEKTFGENCQSIQNRFVEDMDYSLFTGLEVNQKLAKREGIYDRLLTPIVVTSIIESDKLTDEERNEAYQNALNAPESFAEARTSQVWLDHQIIVNSGFVKIIWTVVDELFPEGMMNEMMDAYMEVLESLLTSNGWSAPSISLDQRALKSLVQNANSTEVDFQPESLIAGFERNVVFFPEKVALVQDDHILSYSELNEMAERVASWLQKRNVNEGELVAIVGHKSWLQVVAAIGVLKSGAAYLPIDAGLPVKRIEYLVEDGKCKKVIALNPEVCMSISGDVLDILELEEQTVQTLQNTYEPVAINPATLAYVIYTSGSTGNPKGVMIDHKSALNTCVDINERFGITSDDVLLGVSSLSFDLSVYDIFGILNRGAKLVLPKHSAYPDPVDWMQCIENEKITIWNSAPALADILTQAVGERGERVRSLRVIMLSGDWIGLHLPEKFKAINPESQFYSLGGATEASIWSIYYPVSKEAKYVRSIPYGKALGNQKFYVFDQTLELCPVWATGDLYIGGEGLSLGYWNDAGKTAKAFFKHPVTGESLYSTGDKGRLLPDGNIEFLGRVDNQVKIRGHRIELGEIENCINHHEEIEDAVCAIKKDQAGSPFIVGYYKAATILEEVHLKSMLEEYLPTYMIPRTFMRIDAVPLNSNGKVDRNKLPEPEQSLDSEITNSELTEQELAFIAIASRLLGVSPSLKDNFFDLGGDSLIAARFINRLNDEFGAFVNLGDIFMFPVLGDFFNSIRKGKRDKNIPVISKAADYPVSAGQKRIWLLSQFAEASVAYNIPVSFTLRGKVSTDNIAQALRNVVSRHESLRTTFFQDNAGNIRQIVLDEKDSAIELEYQDLSGKDLVQEETAKVVQQISQHIFDLEKGPLLRCALIKQSEDLFVIAFVIHHIVSDGWSMDVLIRDFLSYTNGQTLEPLPIQYKDFASWQNETLLGESLKQYQEFWMNEFSGEIPLLDLFYDKPREAVKTYSGGLVSKTLSKEKFNKFQAILTDAENTLYMGVLALVNSLLYKYTSQDDIVVGSPIAGRSHHQLEDQIGFFVNTLAIRTHIEGGETYGQLLDRVKTKTLQVFENQSYPFELLVEDLNIKRDTSRSPLFDVMVIVQNTDVRSGNQDSADVSIGIEEFDMDLTSSQFDLSFTFSEGNNGLYVGVNYNSDLFLKATIERLTGHLFNLIDKIIDAPETSLNEIDLKGEDEVRLLNEVFNDTQRDYPIEKTIVDLFREKALEVQDNVALRWENKTMSYGELDALSDQFALFLKDQYKVEEFDLVGVMHKRDNWLITALFGILKCGAAYVPIDPNYPQERIDYIKEDSKSKLLITEEHIEAFERWKITMGNYNKPGYKANKHDLAYVIYTSGSTGLPKGVMISHGNASALVHWANYEFASTPFDVTYAATSVCFDLSIFEIFYTLSTGKSIRILSNALEIPIYLPEDQNVLLNTVPSVVNNLLHERVPLENVSAINMAGEAIPSHIVQELDCERIEVRNLYGPSEDTTYSTYFKLSKDQSILIGRPIHNTKAYILDDSAQMQSIGVPGEICLSGEGLSLGYLYRPELTEEKFVPHPFIDGERIYKTGDIGRWMPDGNIEYLGRKDDQVKIRGFRIELGEIEKVLEQFDPINEAVVLARETEVGGKVLIGFVLGEIEDMSTIKAFLSGKLPDYMIPTYLFKVNAIPLTPNGKTDKKELLNIASSRLEDSTAFVPPRNEFEEQLLEVWKNVLGFNAIGVTDNFFDLGGHSLLAVRIVNRINKQFKINVQVKEIFTYATVAKLASHIKGRHAEAVDVIPATNENGSFHATSGQEKIWLSSQMFENNRAYNMSIHNEFDAAIDLNLVERVFRILIRRNPILRSRFYLEEREVMQEIVPFEEFPMPHEIIDISQSTNDTDTKRLMEGYLTKAFDLDKGPLFKVFTLKENNKISVWLVIHHIICDGVGLQLISNEISYILQNLDAIPDSALAINQAVQFKDYATWLNEKINSPDFKDRTFWKNLFSKECHFKIDTDNKVNQKDDFLATIYEKHLDPEAYSKLRVFCSEHNKSQNQFLLSVMFGLSYRLFNASDVVITVLTNGRNNFELENMLGHMVQLLPLRIEMSGETTFMELLDQVQNTFLESMTYLNYSLDLMEKEINIGHDSPLRNLGFLHQSQYESMNRYDEDYTSDSERMSEQETSLQFNAMTKLLLQTAPVGNRLLLAALYDQNLFTRDTINQFIDCYTQFIAEVLTDPNRSLSSISLSNVLIEEGENLGESAMDFEFDF